MRARAWRCLPCFVLLLFVSPWARAAADEVPVVVAVDISRSLSEADLAAVGKAIVAHLEQLPPGTPLALLSFNDAPKWQVPVGADAQVMAVALAELRPAGSYTVLNDALFAASRGLVQGGVVLVVSDGRDENSATTVDDVARLCGAQHVRIVAASVGRIVDERALRRLALVSKGEYVGGVQSLAPSVAAAAIARAREGVATERSAAVAEPVQPVAPSPAQAAAEAVPEKAASAFPSWLLAVVLAVLVVVAVAVWLVQRKRETPQLVCERCGAQLEPWESSCSRCQIRELEEAVGTQQVAMNVAHIAVPDESLLDPEVFKKSPLPPGLEHTLVLDEQPVLIARQRGKSSRSYALPTDQIFVVGRAPNINTLQVDDPTVSAQHFKVVPKDGDYFVVDLDTTNGTAVNHERVKVRKLRAGDVIRVGAVEFEFKMKVRRVS